MSGSVGAGRFLIAEPAVVVPGYLAGPLWRLLADALVEARRDGRQGLEELEDLARALMAASLAAADRHPPAGSSDVGSSVDVSSSDAGVMTVTGAAALLGVSDRRVRQLLDSGQLAGRRTGGIWLVEAAAVHERQRSKTTDETSSRGQAG